MKFEIKRKGYDKAQVDAYVLETEKCTAEREDRISTLTAELNAAKQKISKFEEKKELIVKAISAAIAKAEQIENLSREKYEAEMDRLKAFHDKWTAYYDNLLLKYPLDEDLEASGRFNREMSEALGPEYVAKSEQARLNNRIGGSGNVEHISPKNTVAYKTGIAAVNPALCGPSESGFSFEEALNPTEDLADIMKGLLED